MKILKKIRRTKKKRKPPLNKSKKRRTMRRRRRKKPRPSNSRDLRMRKPRRISKVRLIVLKTLVSIPLAPTTILICYHSRASKAIIFQDTMASMTWTRSKSTLNLIRFRNWAPSWNFSTQAQGASTTSLSLWTRRAESTVQQTTEPTRHISLLRKGPRIPLSSELRDHPRWPTARWESVLMGITSFQSHLWVTNISNSHVLVSQATSKLSSDFPRPWSPKKEQSYNSRSILSMALSCNAPTSLFKDLKASCRPRNVSHTARTAEYASMENVFAERHSQANIAKKELTRTDPFHFWCSSLWSASS